MGKISFRRWCASWATVALVALSGCGGGGGGGQPATSPPPADPNAASTTVGSAGGTVANAAGVSLTIPAGALPADTTIRIAKDATGAPTLPTDPGLRAVGDTLALTPHGSTFSSDVTLSVPAPSVTLASNEQLALAKAQPGGQWEILDTTQQSGQLVAQVKSFSFVVVVVVSYPLPVYQLAPLDLQVGSPTCDGGPCSSYQGLGPTAISVPVSSNGGQLPSSCGSSKRPAVAITFNRWFLGSNLGPTTITVEMPTAGVKNAGVTLPMPSNGVSISFKRLCTPGGAGYSSGGGSFPIRWSFASGRTSDGALYIYQWPQSSTAVAGTATQLTAQLLVNRPNVTSLPVTNDQEGEVHWESSRDGGQSWRSEGYSREADGTRQPLTTSTPSFPDWLVWASSHGITPTLADNGSLWRLKACWVDVTVTTPTLCVTSSPLALTVLPSADPPGYSQQPRDMTVLVGQTASFTAVAQASPAISGWQWQSRSANSTGAWADIAGATAATYTTPVLGLADNGTQYRALVSNAAGSTASDTVTTSVSDAAVAPSFTSQPLPLAVITGSEAVFAVSARGTEGLSYQWRKDGTAIAGANASTLKLPATSLADAGAYSVVVANAVGSITSQDAALTVSNALPALQAPRLVTAPASLQVHEGDGASLGVNVSGSGPLSYQWFKDGTAVPGATQAIYTVAAAAAADAGSYRVEVSNSVGGLRSAAATLTVLPMSSGGAATAPSIDSPPATLTVTPGLPATLAVSASGTGPLSYQWSHDGADIPGATGAALTLPFVAASDAGTYRVRVSNSAGTALSSAAQIVVVGAPAITGDLANVTVREDGLATFTVTATGDALHYLWMYNGEPWAGSVDAPVLSTPISMADNGSQWRVVVFNGAGIVFSSTRTLTVTPAPGCTGPDNTGWCRNPLNSHLGHVAFGSANVGLAVEQYYDTQVLRTTDGGLTWTPQAALHSSLNFYAYGLAFADANTAVLSGIYADGSPTVLRSTDAGLNWTQVYNSVSGSLSGYPGKPAFLNASVGLVPANHQLLRTTDGGSTWSVITLGTGQWINSLVALPNGQVLGVGGQDTASLLRSTDGGLTWTTLTALPGWLQYLRDLSFVDSLTGMGTIGAGGSGPAQLARTTDGGLTWTLVPVTGSAGFFDAVTLSSDGSGVAINGNLAFQSGDFGATWQAVDLGTTAAMHAATSPSAGVFVVVGDLFVLRNTQGGTGP